MPCLFGCVCVQVLGIYSYIDHNFYVASVPTVRVKARTPHPTS